MSPNIIPKATEEDYAIVFDNTIEVGRHIGYTGTIDWSPVKRVRVSPSELRRWLNEAYRAGQLNAIDNVTSAIQRVKLHGDRLRKMGL